MSKTLDTISKLLNQAENAGTPEEAETFMAKVQELASINNVDLAVARMHQANKEKVQQPEERRIVVNARTRKRNRKHFVELAMAVADVNDVKYLISGNDTSLIAVGFPSDLDVVEHLYAHLAVQMATEADEAIARGDHKELRRVPKTEKVEIPEDHRDWGQYNPATDRYYDDQGYPGQNPHTGEYRAPYPPPKKREKDVLDEHGDIVYEDKMIILVDARVFRGEFYSSFVSRMRGRLWEIRMSVERKRGSEDETSETALALRDKKEDVNKAHEEQRAKVTHMGTWKGAEDTGRQSDYTGIAHTAGRKSAESVPIDSGREVKS